MAWVTFMCGPPVMVARRMIATVMAMPPLCGLFRSTVLSMTDRMPTMTRAVAPPWPAHSATVPKIQTPVLPQQICTENAQPHIREQAQQLLKRPAYLHWPWKQSN